MNNIKVGYTTGVFDMFHIGHLNIIRKAKENCDFLIVGVTSDEEVFRVKGKKPIIPLNERMEIVQAIRYVDKVVIENDTDKITTYQNIKFDIIFKGDDWKGTKKWNDYEVYFRDKGVEILYFPYTVGTSSTQLRNFIKDYSNKR